MKQLTDHAFWLESSVAANCYWLDADGRTAIIDPGMTFGLNRLARELRAAGRSPYEVTDILLTHYDTDHAQSAAEWQRRTGARVWLGAADAAILTGAVPPPATPFRRFSARVALAELPANLHLLDGDAEVWPGLSALTSPGHTPGHHAFRAGRVLFTGDAALCKDGRLGPVPSFLMSDTQRGLADLARLGALDVDWYCCGHSAPQRRR
ncbi:MAG: MBL fold metallo-hydrolase [Actinobacteria bacterium]|nr:MBL fold metallo-hydrolase [Actinomycetota bacterium]